MLVSTSFISVAACRFHKIGIGVAAWSEFPVRFYRGPLQHWITVDHIPVSQYPDGHALIVPRTISDEILDGVIYSSHGIELEGDSPRKKQKLKK